MPKIDFNNTSPIEVFKKYPEFRKRILKNKILWLKNKKTWKVANIAIDKTEDIELVIPSFECIKRVKEKRMSVWFPYFHQVFWFLLKEMRNVSFALSELERISYDFYQFPNGTIVELDKK